MVAGSDNYHAYSSWSLDNIQLKQLAVAVYLRVVLNEKVYKSLKVLFI